MSSDPKPREKLVRVIDEHWVVYVAPMIVCVLLLISGFLLLTLSQYAVHHSEWMWLTSFVLGFGLVLGSLHGIFWVVLGETISQIVITNRRVVRFHDVILLREDMMEVSFEKMKTVEASKHGVLQSILNYGTLHFENAAHIEYVPHPNSAVRDIQQAMGMR